jgi:hypothetical protein
MGLPALPAFQAGQTVESPITIQKKAKKAERTGEAAVGNSATAVTEKSVPPTAETPMTRKARTAATGTAQRVTPTVSESEIASARASGKVWVNTETGVYHKGGQWYGATKQGKFMTEDEAIKSGYRASKGK